MYKNIFNFIIYKYTVCKNATYVIWSFELFLMTRDVVTTVYCLNRGCTCQKRTKEIFL